MAYILYVFIIIIIIDIFDFLKKINKNHTVSLKAMNASLNLVG